MFFHTYNEYFGFIDVDQLRHRNPMKSCFTSCLYLCDVASHSSLKHTVLLNWFFTYLYFQ